MNKLNVFNLITPRPWRYISNWPKNFRDIGFAFKMAYQRITRGYCDWDWYDLDSYFSKLFSETLKEMAVKTISHPCRMEEQEWRDKLIELASNFDMIARDTLDYNPYVKYREEDDMYVDLTDWKVAMAFEEKLGSRRKQLIKDTFNEIAEIYDDLWD